MVGGRPSTLTCEQYTITEIRPDPRARHQHGGWDWLEQGQARAHHEQFRGGRVCNSTRHVAGGANQVITRVACRDALHRRQRWEDAEPGEKHVKFRTSDGLSSSVLCPGD